MFDRRILMTNTTQRLVKTSILLAIATVLSVVKLFSMPFGGTITPASMMPVILIAYIYGTKWGLFSAFIYGILQMITGMNVVSAMFLPGESQMVIWHAVLVCVIDYILAYMMLGFGGVFKNKIKNQSLSIALGTFVSMLLTYIMHIVSGYIFYGAWAEWFFTQDGFYSFGKTIVESFSGNLLSLIYSVIYNGLYMIPEIIITVLLTPFVYAVLKKSKSVL